MTERARRLADAFLAEMAIFFRQQDVTPAAEGTPVGTERHGVLPDATTDNGGPQHRRPAGDHARPRRTTRG